MTHVKPNFPPVLLLDDKGNKVLPPTPHGYKVVEDRTESIGKNWVWGYLGAAEWLATRYVGEAQQPNNVYCKPL